jgi:inorganic phosphate transporter, PiT family
MEHLFGPLTTVQLIFLLLALGFALSFEFVNGFHDTANAVATVIYTHSLPPVVAVVWSGLCNLLGVLRSTGGVAFTVVALLPAELVMNVGSYAGFAMVFSLLISAILWNVGTWYFGLPASSTHSLYGSIMGVGMANSLINNGSLAAGVNWAVVKNVGLVLLISPVVGFALTGLLFLALKAIVKAPELYKTPDPDKAPPLWIRGILCLTCTWVSYSHGSNDGQKGMGLIMLILVGIVPSMYALDMNAPAATMSSLQQQSKAVVAIIQKVAPAAEPDGATATNVLGAYIKTTGTFGDQVLPALGEKNVEIAGYLKGHTSISDIAVKDRGALRTALYLSSETIAKLASKKIITDKNDSDALTDYKTEIDSLTKYIPPWVKVAVAFALGLGTMIGWKRIVVTVGEKIGKSHLTYAQGACAEAIAGLTIQMADKYHLPVSTTHVLSSGVAGAMAANRSGLQMATLRNLLLAWVLTLPVCMFLGAMFFSGSLLLISHIFVRH